ncbi:MAG: SpoIIE family protein phosphatase [Ilumatobacteraceae bacterium]
MAYACGSKLAFELADASNSQAVLFIPAGITLGLLLLSPGRRWPYVLVAAGIAELGLDLDAGLSLGASLGFVVANVAEPTVGALLARKWCGRVDLARLGHVVGFVVGGVLVGPLVGGFVGACVDATISTGDFVTTMLQWWLGDALGALIVGGLIVASATDSDRRRIASAGGLFLLAGSVVLTVGLLTFSDLPLLFLVLVGVVAAGAQFGSRMVTATSVAVALTIAFDFALDDTHVTVGMSTSTALVLTQLQLGIFTLAGLVVAAEAHERELAVETVTAHQQAESNRRRLRNVIDSLFINICITDHRGSLTGANLRGYELTGDRPGAGLGTPFWDLPVWSHDPGVRDLIRHEIDSATRDGQARRFDVHAASAAGLVPLDFQIVPVVDEKGRVEQLVMSSLDITERLRYETELAVALERQQSITQRLQRSLLPESLPVVEGLHIAAVYRSAMADVEVGGDWYDAFELDDHRLALVIGDIVGRGIDAAGATGQLRSATRAIADTGCGPAGLMTRLDRFAHAVPTAVGATMLYVEIDRRTFRAAFCRAGHVPPLLCVPGADPHYLEQAVSPPLATLPPDTPIDGARRAEGSLVLEPGSLLLMCTDGLIERRTESLDEGMRRLADAASRRWGTAPPSDIEDLTDGLGALADELTADQATADDLCILAVHRQPA